MQRTTIITLLCLLFFPGALATFADEKCLEGVEQALDSLDPKDIPLENLPPTEARIYQHSIESVTPESTRQIVDGQARHYVIGTDSRLYFVRGEPELVAGTLPVFTDDTGNAVIAAEYGIMRYDRDKKKLHLDRKDGLGADPSEIDHALESLGPFAKDRETSSPVARTLKCMEMMAMQKMGGKLSDRLISANLVLVGVLSVKEFYNRKDWEQKPGESDDQYERRISQKKKILIGDFIMTNTGAVLAHHTDAYAAQRGLGKTEQVPINLGRMLVNNAIGRLVYGGLLADSEDDKKNPQTDEEKKAASKLANFALGHALFRNIVVNPRINNFMSRTLPPILFKGCQNGSILGATIGPTSVRIIESTGSTFIFYVLRQAVLGK